MESVVYHGTTKNNAETVDLNIEKKNKNADVQVEYDGKTYNDGKNIPVKVGKNYITVKSTVQGENGQTATLTYRVSKCDETKCLDDIFDKYSILVSRICLSENKVLDLDSIDGRVWLHRMLKEFYETVNEILEDDKKYMLGTLINFVFNEPEIADYYRELYHVIACSFNTFNHIKYRDWRLGLRFISERQLCVRNSEEVLNERFYENLKMLSFDEKERKDFKKNIDALYDGKIISLNENNSNKKNNKKNNITQINKYDSKRKNINYKK